MKRVWRAASAGVTCLIGVVLCSVVPASADDATGATATAGADLNSFAVSDSVTGTIDARTGELGVTAALGSVAGVLSEGMTIGIRYRHDLAERGIDRFGFGRGWVLSGTSFIEVDGAVRVFPASGGTYEADGDTASGLARYPQHDIAFRNTVGVIDTRVGSAAYSYVLSHPDGRDYFSDAGDLLVREGLFGGVTVLEWGSEHQLRGVTDSSGVRLDVEWSDNEVAVRSAPRSDGTRSLSRLMIDSDHLASVVDGVGRNVTFTYDDAGLLSEMAGPSGSTVGIAYQDLPTRDGVVDRVESVHVHDAVSGTPIASRTWRNNGEHNSLGFPRYSSVEELHTSGDRSYRFATSLSDGATRVEEEYNALGLVIERRVFVSDTSIPAMETTFSYPGGETVSEALPANFARPTRVATTFRNESDSRLVVEESEFDACGRPVRIVGVDGTITQTSYNEHVPAGFEVPVGLVREELVTAPDGMMTKTVNTPADDHRSVASSEQFTRLQGSDWVRVSRTETVTGADGFVTETRVVHGDDDGPADVTRFSRVVDEGARTVSIAETTEAGTSAEATATTVSDIVSGLPIRSIDAVGRVSSTDYDAAGRVVGQSDTAGRRTVTMFDDHARVSRTTDPAGVTRSEYRDPAGRTVKQTDNVTVAGDGTVVVSNDPAYERVVESREYENHGSTVRVTDALGRVSSVQNDAYGRPVNVERFDGVREVSSYNDAHNTVTTSVVEPGESVANASQTTVSYKDVQGRDIRAQGTRADGRRVPTRETAFNGLGWVSSTSQGDVTTRATFDPRGTVRESVSTPVPGAAGRSVVTNRDYDVRGVATHKEMSSASEIKRGGNRVVDSAGRAVLETNPNGQASMVEYTPDGLVALSESPGGIVVVNQYDAVTRVLETRETSGPSGTTRIAFENDPVTDRVTAVFDTADRAGTEIRYSYDVLGNVVSTTYPDGKSVQNGFDEHSRRTFSRDVEGVVTRYEYNALGGMAKAYHETSGDTAAMSVDYGYDRSGRVDRLSRSNGMVTTFAFSSANEIMSENTTGSDGALVFRGNYDYDERGNLVTKVVTEGESNEVSQTETTTYSYDAYNHLLASTVYNGSVTEGALARATQYEVDVAGNVTKETVAEAGKTVVREFIRGEMNELTAVVTDGVLATQSFDDAGNLRVATDGTTTSYNTANQPVTETQPNGTVIEHSYWVTGQRKATTTTAPEGTQERGFYWHGDTLVNDTLVNDTAATQMGVTTASYLFGMSRVGRVTSEHRDDSFSIVDRHGSTVALADTSGEVATRYSYSDYGTPTVRSIGDRIIENAFQFSGEFTFHDGRQALGARVYDPEVMAFSTRDTAEQFNVYAYASANPIVLVDPSGQTPEFDYLQSGLLGLVGFATVVAGTVVTVASLSGSLGLYLAMGAFGVMDIAAFGVQLADSVLDSWSGSDIFVPNETSEMLGWASLASSVLVGGIAVRNAVATWNRGRQALKNYVPHFKDHAKTVRGIAGSATSIKQKTAAAVAEFRTLFDDYFRYHDQVQALGTADAFRYHRGALGGSKLRHPSGSGRPTAEIERWGLYGRLDKAMADALVEVGLTDQKQLMMMPDITLVTNFSPAALTPRDTSLVVLGGFGFAAAVAVGLPSLHYLLDDSSPF